VSPHARLLRTVGRAAVCPAVFLCCLAPGYARGQSSREINEQTQFWWSLNSTSRLTDRWGVVGDFHIRRNDFIRDPSFYLLRFGANYWLSEALTLTLGYAHNWVAPAHDDWNTWTDENRIYEQIQYVGRLGSMRVLQRCRNEQRWQEVVENDSLTGEIRFSNRVRYLFNLTIPVARNPAVPALVVADELLVQFGSKLVLNPFDQNRFFVGIKQQLHPAWSFDLGYMMVYQQKATGYQYDLNHTLRWFFYCTPDFRKTHSALEPASKAE
jgi:hypothetical protein